MNRCESVADFLLEADLARIHESEAADHLRTCPECKALLARIQDQEARLDVAIAALAETIAADAIIPQRDAIVPIRRGRRAVWRVLAPMAAAGLVAVLLARPGRQAHVPYAGPPEWTLPDVSLQSTHPVVVGSDTHEWVAVIPTDNPNLTLVWFAN